ncbi:MAG: electron transfer flavoprotein subunit beta, partial [Proteobacteria bacterium]|nr:electron transfer flavoprotein subunit beta [Pseudomonadota bacterium]
GNFAAVGPMLATLLGVPHTTTAVSFAKENGTVRVERELEGGALEVVELKTPCLVTTQTGMNQVRYASLKGIMAAKKKPIDVKSVADLGLVGQEGESDAKVNVEKLYTPARGHGAEMLSGSVDEIVTKLVAKIKELGLL